MDFSDELPSPTSVGALQEPGLASLEQHLSNNSKLCENQNGEFWEGGREGGRKLGSTPWVESFPAQKEGVEEFLVPGQGLIVNLTRC